MSLRCCAYSGAQLAAAATCGARCPAFPECLPAVPLELARQVAVTLRSPADEHQAAAAAYDVLDELHAAITEGIARKVGDEQSNPRW